MNQRNINEMSGRIVVTVALFSEICETWVQIWFLMHIFYVNRMLLMVSKKIENVLFFKKFVVLLTKQQTNLEGLYSFGIKETLWLHLVFLFLPRSYHHVLQ